MKNLFIYTNNTEKSLAAAELIKKALKAEGIKVFSEYGSDIDMIVVIGGDGAFLNALKHCNYPPQPILGVNTGHLGFFQELSPDDVDTLVSFCCNGNYTLQHCKLLEVDMQKDSESVKAYAINDICLRDVGGSVIHLKIEVGNNFVETLSGDGMIVASSAGSTAYNYSLRGAIVDPRLEALQLTAMAPINNIVYRSFASSLLFPPSLDIKVTLLDKENLEIGVFADGKKMYYGDFDLMKVSLSDRIVSVVRGSDYDFWSKVESKLL